MRRRKLGLSPWLAAAAGLAAAVLTWNLGQAPAGVSDVDEAAWVFASSKYELLFSRHDLTSSEWTDLTSYSHPPLFKYLLGATLAPEGLAPHDAADYRWWFAKAENPFGAAKFLDELNRRVPQRALNIGRGLNAFCIGAAALLTGLLGAQVFSAPVGAGAALLFALAPLTRINARHALGDGLYVALLLAALWTLLQLVRAVAARASATSVLGWSGLLGALLGLLFQTKISGVGWVPVAAAATLFWVWKSPRRASQRRKALLPALCCATLLVAFACVAIGVNPAFYGHPLDFARRMFEYRLSTLRDQNVLNVWSAFPGFGYRCAGFAASLLHASDVVFAVAPIPLVGALGFLGVTPLARKARATGDPVAVTFIVLAAAWLAETFAAYQIDWWRYVLPLVPLVCILAAAGVEEAWSRRRTKDLIAAGLGAIAVAMLASRITIGQYYENHPRELLDAMLRRAELVVVKFPDEPAARAELDRLRALARKAGST